MKNNQQLFVGNLSWDTDEESLRSAFAQHGNVSEVRVITDRETGRSRGFAFVTMEDGDQAQTAIEAMNGSLLQGRPLRVNVAEPRSPRSGGGNRDAGRGQRW